MLAVPARPRHYADGHRLGLLGLRIQMMGWALDQHAPAFPRLGVELVNFEGDPVLGVVDARPQILVSGALRGGPERESRRYAPCS